MCDFPILSRVDAIKSGSFKYKTGIPCKHGHNTYRSTKTRACAACCRMWANKDLYRFQAREIRITAWAHVDDEKAVYAFIDALAQARKLAGESS